MATASISFTASRHLRHQITKNVRACSLSHLRIGCVSNVLAVTNISTATARRHFADTPGAAAAGLRRTKNSGRHTSTAFPKSQSSTSSSSSLEADPHFIANDRVSAAASGQRTPGTESVATLTTEQKLSNYAMASGMLAFVSYIFYYSLASVGGVEQAKALLFGGGGIDATKSNQEDDGISTNPGFFEFLKEANEGRAVEEKRMNDEQKARREASELAELESSTVARLKAQGMDEVTVAGSAASEEEELEMARVAGFVEDGGAAVVGQRKPLWKRVIFFWRRE